MGLKRMIIIDVEDLLNYVNIEFKNKYPDAIVHRYEHKYILNYMISKILKDDFGYTIQNPILIPTLIMDRLDYMYSSLHDLFWNIVFTYIVSYNENNKNKNTEIEIILFNKSAHIYLEEIGE